MFRDQGPFQSGQGKVPGFGLHLQPLQHASVRWIGLQSFLHQEVLHAVREQAPGPVPTSDSGRAGQEEAELQRCRLMMPDKRSTTCSPMGEKCLTGHIHRPVCNGAGPTLDQTAKTSKIQTPYNLLAWL